MSVSLQFCGLLLYTLCSGVISQERVWHSTTPPAPITSTPTPEHDVAQEAPGTTPLFPAESVAHAESKLQPAEDVTSAAGDSVPDVLTEESKTGNNGKNGRKWISVPPVEEEKDKPTEPEKPIVLVAPPEVEQLLNATAPGVAEEAEDVVPMIHETIISKKTTVYVTFTESLGDAEPEYVNLTGIREFTGHERRIVAGCLDLSYLGLTGEEAKEVIQRMAKHKFHRLDLSNNRIREFPTNTFGPVAFTVRELRLDGNPLLSNTKGESSMLQRGGLFHLTELRDLNMSGCDLHDMDLFTPWNSNHLEVIDLSNNKLREVPSNLQFFHKLKKLYLESNFITKVTELPFALLWNMQVLSLAGCEVSSITSDPFRNMDRLKELSLQGNNLTQIGEVRLSRSASTKLYLSGNPWHCGCDILAFVQHHHYAIRDLEEIRCASPHWLQGLRTAYLSKEILSLDNVDGDCFPPRHEAVAPVPHHHHIKPIRAERLEVFAVSVFALAAIFMLVHILWAKKKEKFRLSDDRDDINYIKIDRKPNFK